MHLEFAELLRGIYFQCILYPFMSTGGKLKEACSVLELCALSTFQPAELFELFPDYTSQWRAQWEAPRYWHINKPFQPLDSILQSTGNEELRYEDRKKNSKTALIEYLLRARELPGIVHLDGIDTLLMHLFIDLRMHEQAAAFASMPNKVVLESVAPRLEQLGWHHSRATLTAARGHVPEALAIWKHIICSEQEDERHSPLEEWELKEARSSILSQLSDASSCSPSLALEYLPWALETFSEEVGKVLSSRRDFEPSVVLPLLKEGSTARWQYLSHLIEVEGMNDPYIHTMFALDLIKSIFSLKPSLQYPLPVHSSQPSKLSKDHGEGTGDDQPTPANGDAILVRRTTPIALVQSPNLSISHLVSYDDNDDDGKLEDKLMIDNVHRLRLKLRNHLEISSLWDEEKVFSLIQHSSLYEETVVVAWKTGDHRLALRILAMTLRDVGAAIQYASAYLAPEQHVDLLHMLLRPEDGSTPRWEDACCVVSAMGEALDPVEVLKVVPDSMPMPAVLHLVSPMLRERVHRRRSGQMTVAMLKCRAVKSSRNLVSVHSLSVIVNEQSTCSDCHLRIGGKVFVVLPTKSISEAAHKAITNNNSHLGGEEITILCFSCWNKRNRHANKENGHS